jgi:cell division ATPase MinD
LARVIGIFSGKGGPGKTTVAVNLASIFAKRYGKDVTLVDCNLTTAHVGFHLGMYNYNVALNHILRDEYNIEDAIYNHHSGMKVVPASVSLSDIKGVDIEKLKEIVKKLDEMNDIIILDAGPGLGREASSAFRATQDVLYVSNPFLPAIIDILRCQSVAAETGTNPLGIVLNMVTKDKHEMKNNEIEYLTELPVIASIPYDKEVRRSLAMKTPVAMLRPNSSSGKEFNRLAARLVEGEAAMDEASFAQFLKQRLKFW